jgi:uroporphyrin-3 C-methyltransferase
VSTEIAGIESESAESPPDENAAGTAEPNETRPRAGGTSLAFFAFLFALLSLAGVGWMWWEGRSDTGQEAEQLSLLTARLESQNKTLTSRLNQLSSEFTSLAADDSKPELDTLQKRIDADDARLGQIAGAVSEQQSVSRSLQSNVNALSRRVEASESTVAGLSTRNLDAVAELDVAEVGYLLRLANERLRLFSDPTSADNALALADSHLAAFDNPMYLGVRQSIASARRQLASVSIPDYLEISNQLNALQQEAGALQFPAGERSTGGDAPQAEEGWWQKVKGVFSNLVTVRRSTPEENQRISLQDEDYIRQGIWLQFEAAQLALMRQDQKTFQVALGRASDTLTTWFGPDGDDYKAVVKGISEVSDLQIQVEMPDISAPWSSLRLLRNARPVTPAPVAPQAEAASEPAETAQGDGNG